MSKESVNFDGYRYLMVRRGNRNYYIGRLPMRKRIALYPETGNVGHKPLAYFTSEAAAKEFVAMSRPDLYETESS